MPIKVLMADDSYVMRSVIRRTLEEEPRIEIVAEATTLYGSGSEDFRI